MLDQRVAFGVLMVLSSLCASCHQGSEATDQVNHQVSAPSGDQASESKSIPLSSIVTTSPQAGMLHTEDQFPQTDGDRDATVANGYLRQILQASKGEASNVFLVDAINAHSAIATSSSVLAANSTAVPEPATWLLLAMSGLVALRRNRFARAVR